MYLPPNMLLDSNMPKLSTACVLYDNIKLIDGAANNYLALACIYFTNHCKMIDSVNAGK